MDELLLSNRTTFLCLAASMRPRQWLKNCFIFAPIIFSKRLDQAGVVVEMTASFCLFCLLSGAVYIINDIFDRETDRLHPDKCGRPIAGGLLPVPVAAAAAASLSLAGILFGFWLKTAIGAALMAYFLLNLCYSLYLKHVVIVDIFAISAGFLLRVMCGIAVAGAQTSEWAYIAAIFLTLFLAFGKRKAELDRQPSGDSLRKVLAEYHPYFLDCVLVMTASGVIVSYMLYTISDYAKLKYGSGNLLLTGVFVLYGLLRYFYLMSHKGLGESPTDLLLVDRPMLINIAAWVAATIYIIYF